MGKSIAERYGTIKNYASYLIVLTVDTDDEGRFVGLSYTQILKRIRRAFPKIKYNGPHKGKPTKMTIKQLREIAYSMQSNNRKLHLPVRPRSEREKKQKPAKLATGVHQKH